MQVQVLHDGTTPFDVTVHEAKPGSPVVLFAVGSGGLPLRHRSLLERLMEAGMTVLAPHFERIQSPMPSPSDLLLRARRLSLSLDSLVPPGTEVFGAGHSIGASLLLALAGAQMWLGPGQRLNIARDNRISRLALLAPPTGFFQAPGALDSVRAPIVVWVGSEDGITPPTQAEWLAEAMCGWQTVDVRISEGAGHFSFMDEPPPKAVEHLSNRQAFLRDHSSEVCEFLIGQGPCS